MQNIRSVFLTIAGAAVLLMAVVVAASVGLALFGILAATMIGTTIAARLAQKPVTAPIRNRPRGQDREPRIWNDGRGTIIDL